MQRMNRVLAGVIVSAATLLSSGMLRSQDSQANQPPATEKEATGNLYVLAIGINAYPKALKLDTAVPDAKAVAKAFQGQEGRGGYGQVRVKMLLDAEATRARILQELDDLAKQVKASDLVVVHFSGHGAVSKDKQFHLLPADVEAPNPLAKGIADQDLLTKLSLLPGTSLLLLDADHAGSFKAPGAPQAGQGAVFVFAGASNQQAVLEANGYGQFTWALLEGLTGKASKSKDGLVTLAHLAKYVSERVKDLSKGEQVPMLLMPPKTRSYPRFASAGELPAPAKERTKTVKRSLVPQAKPEAAEEKSGGVPGLNQFALDLYGKLAAKDGNLFFAPQSIAATVAMTYAGARGETAQQMASVLHQPNQPDQLHATFAELWKQLNGEGGERPYQFFTANALWGQKGAAYLPEFVELLQKHYASGVREADFAGDSEGTRQAINAWVEEHTQKKIADFFPPNSLQNVPPPIWLNAVYFKSAWARPFRKDRTKPGPFYATKGKPAQVPLMSQTARYPYLDAGTFQILELPYKGGDLSLAVLLPKKRDGLAELEKALSAAKLEDWLAKLTPQQVDVTLPRFTLKAGLELAPTLKAMGMVLPFGPQADFAGVYGGEKPFQLAEIIQRTLIEVNEEGTEAAAATAAKGPRGVNLKEPPIFKADHPFVFLIRDLRSGGVLFLGRFVQP